jgi:heterodisulfide reductase subunit A-like polyferredoxin
MTPVAGLVAVLCVAAVLLSAGCESSNRVVDSQVASTCPICERQTRVNPITGLEYTTCLCPSCGTVTTMDPDFALDVERFTGPNVGDRIYAADSCGHILQDCAACRQARR